MVVYILSDAYDVISVHATVEKAVKARAAYVKKYGEDINLTIEEADVE